jgi:hypothetical protein
MYPMNYIKIILLIAIGFIFGMTLTKQCSGPKITIKTETTHDTLWHTPITKWLAAKLPDTVYHDTGSVKIKILTRIDTIKAVNDYLAFKIYRRVLLDDSTAKIQLVDTVTQNALKGGGKLFYLNRLPSIVNNVTTITNPARRQVYFGGGCGTEFIKPTKLYLPLGIILKTKKDNIFQLQADPFNKIAIFSTYFKIKF